MDLYAYMQIESLEDILKKQNIQVPRLRGLRLMKEETIVTEENIKEAIHNMELDLVTRIVEQNSLTCWCSWKDGTRNDILIRDKDKRVIGYRWNKIHGKKRKWIKREIKQMIKNVRSEYNVFNSFVGKNVLYVHSRIGGNNWDWYNGDALKQHPDYLGHVDDYFDSTYCDIYFKIRGVESE